MAVNRVFDGSASYLGGVDYGQQPNLIRDNQVWNAVNATMRGGYVTNRPPYTQRQLSFSIPESYSRFVTGVPQGITVYQSGDNAYLVVSSGGRIYSIDPIGGFSGQDLTPDDGNATNIPKTYFSQWENYLIIQDGQSRPIYLNGLTATRDTRTQNGIPVGTAMAYGWGRGWVGNGTQFVAGDINDVTIAQSVITFSEQNFLNEGGAFQLPAMLGSINGMAFIPLQDTATGQGQLLIGGDYGVGSVNGGIPRDQWKQVQIQQVAMLNIGWASQSANVLLNGDIFFRSYDGIRSYRMARAQQGLNGNTPQSEEVYPYVSTDAQSLLKYASGVNFDNRILITTGPQWMGNYCRWKGLVVLDSYPCGSLWSAAPPVWEGMWDGIDIVQICTGVFNKETRCFALVRREDNTEISSVFSMAEVSETEFQITVVDPSGFTEGGVYNIPQYGYFRVDSISGNVLTVSPISDLEVAPVGSSIVLGGRNEIWEILKSGNFDVRNGENVPIRSSITTRSYGFRNPFGSKKLEQMNFWVDNVVGQVDWTAQFRPDQYPCLFNFGSGSLCQEFENCDNETCPTLTKLPSYKPRITVGAPDPRACNNVSEQPQGNGYEFQVFLEWTGKMRIRQLRVAAIATSDPTRADC
jgi:hypothetical protein